MKKFVILGTAGHIDHGKTSLVKKLTGVDTDRWEEEKKRGMTIDIGFAKLQLPGNKVVGIVDVPGHEKFIKNMLAGAHGIDIVLLVIAADEGVMPQTREHVLVCEALGVKGGIIALTKKDLVDEEWLELVKEDVKDFIKGTSFEGAPVVPVSSKTEEGIDILVSEIEKLAEKVKPKSETGLFRLPVDRSFSVKGFGTVVTGTVLSGKVKVGDSVSIYPGGRKVKVRGIQTHEVPVEVAFAGQRAALNLSEVSKEEVKRGDLISVPGMLTPTKIVDVKLTLSSDSPFTISSGKRVHFHHLTSEVEGEVFLIGKEELLPGESGFAQLKLSKEVVPIHGDRFVIRSYSPTRVIGGGKILDPLPGKRFRKKFSKFWMEKLSAFESENKEKILDFIVKSSGISGFEKQEIVQRIDIHPDDVEAFLRSCKGIKISGDRLYSTQVVNHLVERSFSMIDEFHKRFPLLPGINKESLRTMLDVSNELFALVLDEILKSPNYVEEEGILKKKGFKPYVKGTKYEDLYKKVKATVESAGFKPPDAREICRIVKASEDEANLVISYLLSYEGFERVGDFIFSPKAIKDVKSILCSHFSKKSTLSIRELKEYLSLTRKHVIPLLEYLDRKGFLIRSNDERIRGEKLTCK